MAVETITEIRKIALVTTTAVFPLPRACEQNTPGTTLANHPRLTTPVCPREWLCTETALCHRRLAHSLRSATTATSPSATTKPAAAVGSSRVGWWQARENSQPMAPSTQRPASVLAQPTRREEVPCRSFLQSSRERERECAWPVQVRVPRTAASRFSPWVLLAGKWLLNLSSRGLGNHYGTHDASARNAIGCFVYHAPIARQWYQW